MITVEARRLAQIMTLVALVMAPLTLSLLYGEAAAWPGFWEPWLLPALLLAELALHTALLSTQGQVRSFMPCLTVAWVFTLMRGAAVGVATGLLWLFAPDPSRLALGAVYGLLWGGVPISAAIQVGIVLLAQPIFLHTWAPGFLSQQALDEMSPKTPETAAVPVVEPLPTDRPTPSRQTPAPQAQPFLYSFPELERYVERVIGLEGFVLLSDEGLVVWERTPWQEDPQDIASHLVQWVRGTQCLVPGSDALPISATVHSGDHWIVACPLPGNHVLHLFVKESLPVEQVAETCTRLRDATSALVTHRFESPPAPAAGLATPLAGTAV